MIFSYLHFSSELIYSSRFLNEHSLLSWITWNTKWGPYSTRYCVRMTPLSTNVLPYLHLDELLWLLQSMFKFLKCILKISQISTSLMMNMLISKNKLKWHLTTNNQQGYNYSIYSWIFCAPWNSRVENVTKVLKVRSCPNLLSQVILFEYRLHYASLWQFLVILW